MAKGTKIATQDAPGEVIPYDYKQDAGRGWENTDSQDFLVPFLSQLQAISDELKKGNPKFIPGAEAGDFVNSVSRQLYKGSVDLVPITTQHKYVEWVPRKKGGGFVGVHEAGSDAVRSAKSQAASQINLTTPSGNDLQETFLIYALVLEAGAPSGYVVISFTRTKIKPYKQALTRLRTFRGSKSVPLYAHRLRMLSVQETRTAGTYFNVKLEPAVDNDVQSSLLPPDSPVLAAAREALENVLSGKARVDFEAASSSSESAEETDDAF